MNDRKLLGALGEEMAVSILYAQGFDIEERNYTCRHGEIDIIARRGQELAFVEVKTRAADAWYTPREAVDPAKQARLYKTALYFLSQHPTDLQPRFDVIEIYASEGTQTIKPTINHIEDAFS
jgi:putative endonuclease